MEYAQAGGLRRYFCSRRIFRKNRFPFFRIMLDDGAVSTGERLADHDRHVRLAIRLGEQQHAAVEPAVMNDGVLGIARGEQHLQPGFAASAPRRQAGGRSWRPGMMTSVNSRSNALPAVDDRQRFGRVRRVQRARSPASRSWVSTYRAPACRPRRPGSSRARRRRADAVGASAAAGQLRSPAADRS